MKLEELESKTGQELLKYIRNTMQLIYLHLLMAVIITFYSSSIIYGIFGLWGLIAILLSSLIFFSLVLEKEFAWLKRFRSFMKTVIKFNNNKIFKNDLSEANTPEFKEVIISAIVKNSLI